jgi:hypothetical protein
MTYSAPTSAAAVDADNGDEPALTLIETWTT